MPDSTQRAVSANATYSTVLPLWTVYENPSDFPGKFVARKWEVSRGIAMATAEHHVGDTLEDVRAALPAFVHRIPRQPGDDACIVECWL